MALLALIDTYCSTGSLYLPMPQRLASHIRTMSGLPLREWSDYLALRVGKLSGRAGRTLKRRVLPAAGGGKWPGLRALNWYDSQDVLMAINVAHELEPYEGDAVLFKADLNVGQRPDAHDGWYDLIRNDLRVIPVSGSHMGILREPHVCELAGKLAECLEE